MRSRPLLAFNLVPLCLVVACSPLRHPGDLKVVQAEGKSYQIDILDNSATFSQALAINDSGEMIGIREVADAAGTIYSQESFFFDGKTTATVAKLEGFSNVEIHALSDTGLVVGYASRPMGHPDGSLAAVVWDSKEGKLTKLPPVDGDISAHAQDISADGRRISGYSNGSQPPRIRPCVWTWNKATAKWDVEVLSVISDYNPYMMSSSVIVSPDGNRLATCLTVAQLPNGQYDSSLFMWDYVDGSWERRLVSDEQMRLRDMNNAGQMVGVYSSEQGRRPCVVDLQGQITLIDLLAGDASGEAHGINATGKVVGFSDDPLGPEGGPQAFIWQQGTTSLLELPEGTVFSSAFGINDAGQIAGLLDMPLPDAAKKKTDASESAEPLEKTLAFRWTPKPKQP